MPTEDQYAGCFIGQCLGDALGFPVEGAPQEQCAAYAQQVLHSDEIFQQTRGPFRFGQYSDDSQLARELLLSYLHQEVFDPEDYAKRIATLFANQAIVGRGRATEQAANRLLQGVPWEQAGTPAPEAGNGSAMRAGPVGLLFWQDPPALVRAAHDQGRITHQDPRCSGGAVAIAGAVALVLQQDPLNIPNLLAQLATWTRPFDPLLAAALVSLEDWINLAPQAAFQQIAPTGLAPAYLPPPPVITPFVTTSVLWSLYSFLHAPDSYLAAIATAISAGGDVDTTAAMTGAISGAWLGLQKLPAQLTARLNDRGSWQYADLVYVAQKTYRRVLCQ